MKDSDPASDNLEIDLHSAHAPRLKRMRQLTKLLDNAIAIPGTKQRIGLDPILGLIPGGGDTVSAALSGYIIIEAARMGLPRSALMRMVGNIFLDMVVGSAPFFGDIYDTVSKANVRNMQIVERHLNLPQQSVKADRLFIGLLIIVIIALALAAGAISVLVFSWIFKMLSS
jgi:predicted small integral membrane protein